MRVIFLDVDGVLNHPTHWAYVTRCGIKGPTAQIDPACLARLLQVARHTGARFVVSSSHRSGSVAETRRTFAAYGIRPALVVGMTPRYPAPSTRGDEIAAWLARYGERVERFAILDDGADMGDLLPYLVRTDGETGLSGDDCARLAALLEAGS